MIIFLYAGLIGVALGTVAGLIYRKFNKDED